MTLPGLKEPEIHMGGVVAIRCRVSWEIDMSAVAFDALSRLANGRLQTA